MIHMSSIRSEIANSSLVPVLQNGQKTQLSILILSFKYLLLMQCYKIATYLVVHFQLILYLWLDTL